MKRGDRRGDRRGDDLLRNLHGFGNQVELVRKNISIPSDQMEFNFSSFGKRPYSTSITTFSGYCFEKVTAAIFGGYHHKGAIISYDNGEEVIQPDVSNHRDRIYYEVKSCQWTSQLKLIRTQIEKNLRWMLHEDSGEDTESNFVFYRHRIMNMQRRNLTKQELLDEMLDNGILYAIKTPISISAQFFLHPGKIDKKRYVLNTYDYSDRIKYGYGSYQILSTSAMFLNDLIKSPEDTIGNLGLDPDDFEVERARVSGIKINKRKLAEFPMMFIKQKDVRKWIAENKEIFEFLFGKVRDENVTLPQYDPNDEAYGDPERYKPKNYSECEVPFEIPEIEPDDFEEGDGFLF